MRLSPERRGHDNRHDDILATSGLGFMVQSAAQFLVTDVVVLGILVIALIAFAMEMGLRALQRKPRLESAGCSLLALGAV